MEETEEQFLEDSDDTDVDSSSELPESESDSDISEPSISISTPSISIITQQSNTPQTSRSESRSPKAQNAYYLWRDK